MNGNIQMKPEQDITAFELAHLIMASHTFRDHEGCKKYLDKACPSAIRHVPSWHSVKGD